jgi:hypothetical protein
MWPRALRPKSATTPFARLTKAGVGPLSTAHVDAGSRGAVRRRHHLPGQRGLRRPLGGQHQRCGTARPQAILGLPGRCPNDQGLPERTPCADWPFTRDPWERRHIDSRHQLMESIVVTGVWRGLRRARASDGTTPETTQSQFRLPGGTAYERPLGALTSLDTPTGSPPAVPPDGNQYAGASLRVVGTAFANRPSQWRCSLPSCQSLALRSGL